MIYIMYPNCMHDITILAQAVLQVFCSQGSIGFQWESRKTKNVEKGL